jgi:hypothetical protein
MDLLDEKSRWHRWLNSQERNTAEFPSNDPSLSGKVNSAIFVRVAWQIFKETAPSHGFESVENGRSIGLCG